MSKTYQQFLIEKSGKTAVYTFGRFNPPTIGHEKLLRVVESTSTKEGGDILFTQVTHKIQRKIHFPTNKQSTFSNLFFQNIEHSLKTVQQKLLYMQLQKSTIRVDIQN